MSHQLHILTDDYTLEFKRKCPLVLKIKNFIAFNMRNNIA